MEMDIGGIARSVISTPCYVYDARIIVRNYTRLRECLGTRLLLSVKANPLLELFARSPEIAQDGVELASLGELQMMDAFPNCPKYVNNPSMAENFMQAALQRGTVLTIDSLSQIHRLIQVLSGRTTEVVLRLNAACVLPEGKPADHFGLSLADAKTAAQRLRIAGCRVQGLHVFAGSNSFGHHSLALVDATAAFANELEAVMDARLHSLNLGGGFPADWPRLSTLIREYAAHIEPLITRWEIHHESGRAVFASAGAFITKIVAAKRLRNEYIAVCDGGMAQNFLLARTEGLLRKPAAPTLLPTRLDRADNESPCAVRYVGSSCSSSDVIGYDPAAILIPEPGDLCVFGDCGAYNRTYTLTPFLMLDEAESYVLPDLAVA